MAKPTAKKTDASSAISALFKIDKGQIINAPDTSAVWIDRERLEPNPFQPRRRFDSLAIAELGENMKAVGQIEAITVRPHPNATTDSAKQNVFQIVAGERRWRAAAPEIGNLAKLRCVVRDLSDMEVLAIALSENAHRQDVSPIEFARGLARLKESAPSCTWDAVLDQVKVARRRLFQLVSLLDLPKELQERIDGGDLNEKHGRALLELAKDSTSQGALLRAIESEGLSGNASLARAKQMREAGKEVKVQPGALRVQGVIPDTPHHKESSPTVPLVGTSNTNGKNQKDDPSGDSTSRQVDIITTALVPAKKFLAEAASALAELETSTTYRKKVLREIKEVEAHITSIRDNLRVHDAEL